MSGKERVPVAVPLQPHLADHRFEGRAVFPAVEALQLLARTVSERFPHVPVLTSRDASFPRFLPVPARAACLEAVVELEPCSDRAVTARLLTQTRIGAAGMGRMLEHAEVTFAPAPSPSPPPASVLAAPSGPGLTVRSTDLYGAMVPFGPAYHNARDPIVLTPDGAAGRVVCPHLPYPGGPLGSPFPFDAAFHIACGWGERHVGAVLFPAGFQSRFVARPTEPGGTYLCRVIPHAERSADCPAWASFDLWIFDPDANLREVCFGVRMEDVSRGRFRPPDWGLWDGTDPLAPLKCDLLDLVAFELPAVLQPLAASTLTPGELELASGLGERRRPSFVAARTALKRLARRLAQPPADDTTLRTIAADGMRPICPAGTEAPYCSVAHDRRFVVAVAAGGPVGVDVEPVADP
ncbi:MAG: hypothetical protein FJ109_20135, partial [Deltaproteobacteria bacterium]|nr:hypothetical protein [Deltaproteobacteria bacterium]